jgi:hypothetical protein
LIATGSPLCTVSPLYTTQHLPSPAIIIAYPLTIKITYDSVDDPDPDPIRIQVGKNIENIQRDK